MRKIILIIAVIAVLALPSASFASSLGQFATPVNAGPVSGQPNVNVVIRNAAAVTATHNATAVNTNQILTFGFNNFKLANPGFKILKNVSLNVERMQDLGTFAAVGFNFKF